MASGELGALVDAELNSLGINTAPEVATFRALPRTRTNDMVTVINNIQVTQSQQWISRKRVRHDALKLLNEGAL